MPNVLLAALHELKNNQESDFYAQMSEKELLKTKEGKPYLRVAFRDAYQEVRFPVWSDTPIYKEFKTLKAGTYCKLRAVYRDNRQYGPQLDIRRIRPVNDEDKKDGFDPLLLRAKSPFSLEKMFDELHDIAVQQIGKGTLLQLVSKILKDQRTALQTAVGSRHHHHCFVGGLLEHTLSVTKICVALLDHYETMYPKRKDKISRGLTVAGAVLHDIGKIREYVPGAGAAEHSTEGELLGHAVLGRDIIRDAAAVILLEPEQRMRLEHIVLSHQRFADWGAAKPPMSLEAMLVHHADSLDALTGCFWNIFEQDNTDNELTSKKNVIGYPLLKPAE
ncbi:MAG: HD domain-containing protein [Planctomycetaceae bacterium]|jgi:3'-5' exoribonuclease|nr:HD domain-containing protein [Planctomycetaceae bacterium]